MNKNKVIITGGLGFIGSNLINLFLKKFQIYNFDKLSEQSNLKFINHQNKNYNFKN